MGEAPSDAAEKALWKEQRAAVRRILMDHWDPIGVRGLIDDIPEAATEYDAYVGGVASMLRSGAPIASIETELRSIVTERMGMTNARVDYPTLLRKLAELNIGD